jgi:hypothetical protein
MGLIERRYGIAGEAAGKAALEYGAGRKATDAFVLSRIARAVVDALDADDRGAVEENERLRGGLRAALDYLELVPDDSVDYEAALIRVRDALGGQS